MSPAPRHRALVLVSSRCLCAALHAADRSMGALLAYTAARGLNAFTPISVACVAGEDAYFAGDVIELIAGYLGVRVGQLAPSREPEPGAAAALAAHRVGSRSKSTAVAA